MSVFASESLCIAEPALLLRIGRLFRPGMNAAEVYDTTRGIWKLGPKRSRARYAFAVVDQKVIEVYVIDGWHPAGTTVYESGRRLNLDQCAGRWEFIGRPGSEDLRERYLGKSVAHYFPKGAMNAIRYVSVTE